MTDGHGNTQRLRAFARAGLLAALLGGTMGGAALAQGQAMPPSPVGVMVLETRTFPVVSELPGRVAATRISEVRARVTGILQERVFEQGAMVEAGDVLYRIDPKLFRVRVASAEAALAKAKATRDNAQKQLERQRTLKERNAVSGVDLDIAEVTVAQADADVALAEAALDEMRINLEYTEVRAPISGLIGAALVTEGALVTGDSGTVMAEIQQIDPVYADFTQSSSDLLALKRAVDQGKLASPAPGQATVELVLDDGSTYAEKGKLLFASAQVDATTGQVTMRAEFPNPRGDLLPGLYVRIRIEQAVRENAIVVPQRAVVRSGDGGSQVYILKADNTVELRPVKLGRASGNDWLVESGLEAGETIVVEGLKKIGPGATVAPDQAPAAAAEAPAPAEGQAD